MADRTKVILVDAAIKLLVGSGVALWCFIIYTLAVSGLPMMRQLLGCMLSTMAIFGLLSLSVRSLKNYLTVLKNEQI